MGAFEESNHVPRNLLFTSLGLLGNFAIEKNSKVLVDWVFHDRTNDVRKNAFGCLFRYVTVGLEIDEEMTLADFFGEVTERSNESLAHCSYEWSVKRDNVFDHDMTIVCYETSGIMSDDLIGSIGGTRLNVETHALVNSRGLAIQVIENADGIVAYLMFNQAIYSEKKVNMAVDVFSTLLDRILKSEDPGQIKVVELMLSARFSASPGCR